MRIWWARPVPAARLQVARHLVRNPIPKPAASGDTQATSPVQVEGSHVVTQELAGRPLDGALRALTSVPWSVARSMIETGKVKVSGALATSARRRREPARLDDDRDGGRPRREPLPRGEPAGSDVAFGRPRGARAACPARADARLQPGRRDASRRRRAARCG